MFIWIKLVKPSWLDENEQALRDRAGQDLAIISEPSRRKSLRVEVACKSRVRAYQLVRNFGGRIEKLSGDWFERFSRAEKRKPLKIGKRLIITDAKPQRNRGHRPRLQLIIPAGMAFGTGEHATTAMSLRLLESITREMRPGWSLLDLGTGSGILALAAKCFGAARLLAIDDDARAIATAKENARVNKMENINFRVADVRGWRPASKNDIITANLFSELLIEIVPKLRRGIRLNGRLILSGVLRNQERALRRAMRSNKLDVTEVRRRGKWIAVVGAVA